MFSSGNLDIEPVSRSRKAARKSYDQISRWYDLLTGSSEWRYTKQGLEMLAPQKGESILEIGCGTGKALVALAEAVGMDGNVVGLDISGGMLTVAGQRLRSAGLLDRVELVDADAMDGLPCNDRCHDAIFMSFFLDLIDTPEIQPLLGDCRRVLKSKGRIGIVAMSPERERGLMPRLYRWAHRRFPNRIDCRPIPARRLLKDAGFMIDDWRFESMWGLPVEIVRGS
ncbi:MAG: methyltransferase domain-containing protein [bacterium]